MRLGNSLIVIGIGLTLLGVSVKAGIFGWFGNLPGDYRNETERNAIFIPFTSMLVLSVAASIIATILRRWTRG